VPRSRANASNNLAAPRVKRRRKPLKRRQRAVRSRRGAHVLFCATVQSEWSLKVEHVADNGQGATRPH
jgi:hypothetical protein